MKTEIEIEESDIIEGIEHGLHRSICSINSIRGINWFRDILIEGIAIGVQKYLEDNPEKINLGCSCKK